jgi:predicted small lipoprotein YifL
MNGMSDTMEDYKENIPHPLVGGGRGRGDDPSVILRACVSLALIVTLALTLAACGKRGDPEPPDGKADEFPRQYPDPSSL